MEIGSCYRPEYLPASFNGVGFEAIDVSSAHGRRGAEGEFPFGEDTAYADLGRKIRRYTISGRLVTNDHLSQASNLIAACEMPGPGTLVHPTRGVLQAACVSATIRDNVLEEQGITYVELEFVEGLSWANGLILTSSLLGVTLQPVLTASSGSFLTNYHPHLEPLWKRTLLRNLAQGAAGIIADEYRHSIGNTRQLSSLRAAADLETVAADPELVADPMTMDETIRLGSNAISQNLEPEDKFETFRKIANWAASQSSGGTVSGDALISHTRIVAAAYMAQAAVATNYQTMQEVFSHLDMVAATFAQEMRMAYSDCDNNVYLMLSQFADDFIATMYKKAYGVPTAVQYDFGGAVSPLVAAYAIWNDAKRHREIEQTNYMPRLNRVGPVVVGAA